MTHSRFLRFTLALATMAVSTVAATTTAPSTAAALDSTPWTLPVTPPRCTTTQANSGDVAGCLMVFYNDPSTIGWGSPPAPGVGTGWNWSGYWYNGSPALAGWESTQIATNTTTVAGMRAGTLQTHTYAQPLFEGFLAEIAANGYAVHGASGYSFRCTSGNGGWSCPSGDPDDLSNHAWGLAIDMNAGTNPIRSYAGINGATACQTPVQTDMPRWVIQTAEKWGLYWGGYGWNSGCQSTSTQRSSVYRDPPHFEFRGTPAQAQAIYEFNLRNDPRRQCFDTVTEAGTALEQCNVTGVPEAGWRLPVDTAPPAGATAAMINITATEPAAAGFLTLEACSPNQPHDTSAVNFAKGETAAAMAVVPIDANGRFCVYRSTAVHSIVDVVGYLTDSGERLWFDPSTPQRLVDTRETGNGARVADQSSVAVPTSDAAPRIANLTVVDSAGAGHAKAATCADVAASEFSNINYVAGTTRANMVLLDNDAAGSCVWVHRATHVAVDELGRLLPDDGLGWRIEPSRRVLDTRECAANWCNGQPAGGTAFEVDLGVDAPAAAVTLTIDRVSAPGHAWIGNCAELIDGGPTTSNINYVPGKAIANMAIVAPDDGKVCVYLHAAADVIIDVQAELVADRTLGLRPITPKRVHDSRG
ncbi:MAG: M15 family metallopeptidase [Ilumatobacteraceae bacterium]